MKRVRPAPMGRAFRVLKRTAHLTVHVTERAPKVVLAAEGAPKRKRAPVKNVKNVKHVKKADGKKKAGAAKDNA
jgi:large subunit ribosomal protein L22